jgi:hypothetical protein
MTTDNEMSCDVDKLDVSDCGLKLATSDGLDSD